MAAPSSICTSITELYTNATERVYSVTIFFKQSILTTVTKHHSAVAEWINSVKADGDTDRRHVGFEMEFDFMASRIGTVQLCVGSRCLVFQLLEAWPDVLDQFLKEPNNVLVGTSIPFKLDLLNKVLPIGASAVQVVDLRDKKPKWRDDWNMIGVSMQTNILSSIGVVGLQHDWARLNDLSLPQVHYACIHAFLNIKIASWISNQL